VGRFEELGEPLRVVGDDGDVVLRPGEVDGRVGRGEDLRLALRVVGREHLVLGDGLGRVGGDRVAEIEGVQILRGQLDAHRFAARAASIELEDGDCLAGALRVGPDGDEGRKIPVVDPLGLLRFSKLHAVADDERELRHLERGDLARELPHGDGGRAAVGKSQRDESLLDLGLAHLDVAVAAQAQLAVAGRKVEEERAGRSLTLDAQIGGDVAGVGGGPGEVPEPEHRDLPVS
jgi:hypothetical protein